jgi:Limiting CO2-inducible proteins B/C beta carbonyic anhydrases
MHRRTAKPPNISSQLHAAVQALAVDDFLARVEVALAAYGFRGDNSLALTNVCRDESTGACTIARPARFSASFFPAGSAFLVFVALACPRALPALCASAGCRARCACVRKTPRLVQGCTCGGGLTSVI